MKLTYGSLFSGVGGMDLGFDQHMDCVFQVEWDKHAQAILRRYWPDVPKWEDVCDVNGAELPPCDVFTFGSPCQDLSVAGKRAGLDGGRSSMFFEAIRIIKEMRDATASRPTGPVPRCVVWENVPGAFSSNGGADFQAVIDSLGDIGAVDIQWSVLDAQHFGVPQRRRRIFLVAVFDPATAERGGGEILPVREGRARDFASGRKKGQEPARSAAAGSAGGGFRILGFGHYAEDDTASALKQRDYKDATDLVAVAFQPVILDGTRVNNVRVYQDGLTPALKARMGTGGNNVPMIYSFDTQFGSNENVFEDMSPTLKASQQSPSVAEPFVKARCAQSADDFETWVESDVSPKLNAFDNGGETRATVLMPTSYAVRRLTPLECERLMGWPDDHTRYTDTGKEQADSHRYKQCGNGVATPVAAWVAKHIARIV